MSEDNLHALRVRTARLEKRRDGEPDPYQIEEIDYDERGEAVAHRITTTAERSQ